MNSLFQVNDKIKGRYFVNKIVLGGVGIVYLCQDLEWEQPVALKTLKPDYIEDTCMYNVFCEEANNWIELDKHLNIVCCNFIEDVYGVPYIVMEYIDGNASYGNSLRSWLDKKYMFRLPELLNIWSQFCDGMIYCSQKFKKLNRTFTHGDIKPENILITKNKVIKITDFGLNGGTIGYMSPEQERGDALDERSDIFSFGTTMKEMYNASELIHENRVRDIIGKCLQEKVELRYQDFTELRNDINNLCQDILGEETSKPATEKLSYMQLNNKGTSKGTIGNHQEAMDIFDDILSIKMNGSRIDNFSETIGSYVTWYNKGMALENIKRYDEAIQCYDMALSIDDSHARIWAQKGACCIALEKYEQAFSYLEKALELDPKDVNSLSNLGLIYKKRKEYNKAIALFKSTLQIDPNHIETKNNLSNILLEQKRYDEAEVMCDEILKLNPNYSNALLNKGAVLQLKEQYEDALYYYDKVISINPGDWVSSLNKIYCEYKLNNFNKMYEACKETIHLIFETEAYTSNSEVYIHLAKCYYFINYLPEVYYYLDKYIEINPNNTDVNEFLKYVDIEYEIHSYVDDDSKVMAEMLEKAQYSECLEYVSEKIDEMLIISKKLEENVGIAYYLLTYYSFKGYCLNELDRKEEAIDVYDKMLKINHSCSEAWYGKGICLYRIGLLQEALNCFSKAILYQYGQDKIKDILYYKGTIYEELGNYEAAQKCYKLNIDI